MSQYTAELIVPKIILFPAKPMSNGLLRLCQVMLRGAITATHTNMFLGSTRPLILIQSTAKEITIKGKLTEIRPLPKPLDDVCLKSSHTSGSGETLKCFPS